MLNTKICIEIQKTNKNLFLHKPTPEVFSSELFVAEKVLLWALWALQQGNSDDICLFLL